MVDSYISSQSPNIIKNKIINDGSKIIKFKSDIDGATNRTLHEKISERMISVFDFLSEDEIKSVLSDGGGDVSDSFQEAINNTSSLFFTKRYLQNIRNFKSN